jgi:hypothetical protein
VAVAAVRSLLGSHLRRRHSTCRGMPTQRGPAYNLPTPCLPHWSSPPSPRRGPSCVEALAEKCHSHTKLTVIEQLLNQLMVLFCKTCAKVPLFSGSCRRWPPRGCWCWCCCLRARARPRPPAQTQAPSCSWPRKDTGVDISRVGCPRAAKYWH